MYLYLTCLWLTRTGTLNQLSESGLPVDDESHFETSFWKSQLNQFRSAAVAGRHVNVLAPNTCVLTGTPFM